MADAKQKEAWNHTAQLLAMTANANNDWKKNPKGYESIDFMPASLRPRKSRLEREADAMHYHLNQLAQLPAEKFDEAFQRFVNRMKD